MSHKGSCNSLIFWIEISECILYCIVQLHLLIDSPYYTDRIIGKMSRFGPNSKLFVTIKSHQDVRILEGDDQSTLTLRGLNVWLRKKNISSVYIHFLSNSIAYALYKSDLIRLPCYWIMWGADFYGLPAFSDRYYLPKSLPFAWKNNTWKHKLAQFLGLPSSTYVMKVLKKIEYFVGYEEEFTLTQMALKHEMKFVPWEYYFSINELNRPAVNQGQGAILLGNSDDPMNNHLDVLQKLEQVVTTDQRIIIPVAGGSKVYIEKLKEVQSRSKAEIVLQETLLDSKSFFELMNEVSYVVYGHLRQQGVGTILPLLYAGKKAFLWEQNPLKAILERWGIAIDAIDSLSSEDFKKLSAEEVSNHRKKMDTILSVEADTARWSRILKS